MEQVKTYCYCKLDINEGFVECTGSPSDDDVGWCPGNRWFHFSCVGLDAKTAIEKISTFICPDCTVATGKKITFENKYKSISAKVTKEIEQFISSKWGINSNVQPMEVDEYIEHDEYDELENQQPQPNFTEADLCYYCDNEDWELPPPHLQQQQQQDISNDNYYKVEELLRVGDDEETNERMWLVKWVGYEDNETNNTWMPESELASCQELVDRRASELGLPLSKLAPVAGANISKKDVKFNINNWVTSNRVKKEIQMYINSLQQYNSNIKLEVLDLCKLKQVSNKKEDVLYIFIFEQHLYITYWDHIKQVGLIGDGLNMALEDKRILKDLTNLLKIKLIPFKSDIQKGADHCGAAAVAIGLDVLRQMKGAGRTLIEPIMFGQKTFDAILKRMHPERSESYDGWKPISEINKYKVCPKCNEFKIPVRSDIRKLQAHMRFKCKN